jgi:hypothetical protein
LSLLNFSQAAMNCDKLSYMSFKPIFYWTFALVLFTSGPVGYADEAADFTACIDSAYGKSTLREFAAICKVCHAKSDMFDNINKCVDGGKSFCLTKNGCQGDDADCKSLLKCKTPGQTQEEGPTSPTRPTSPANPTTPTKPGTSSPQSTTATQEQCNNAAKDAGNCCNRPETCGGAQVSAPVQTPGQSMQDYCKQMDAAGQANTEANNRAGQACSQKIETCKTTCNNAGDSSSAQNCSSLISKVKSMGSQGLASLSSSGNGAQCNSLTQAQPQSTNSANAMPQSNQNNQSQTASTNNPNDPTGCISNPASDQCQKCTANPNDPSCGVPQQRGTSAFSENSEPPTDASGFDVGDSPAASRSLFDVGGDMQTGQPAKNGTVANNTGGGVGGSGGGGGGGAASLGGGGRRPSPGSPGYSTDILQGHLSGGYTTPGGSGDTSGSGGWGGYGGRNPAGEGNHGLDLKQFLPGHKKAPAFVGGAYTMHSAEIAGKHGDIFEKISRKFKEKCMLGQLISCEN